MIARLRLLWLTMTVSAWMRPRSWKVGLISAAGSSSLVVSADGHGAGSAGGGDCGGGSALGGPSTAAGCPAPRAAHSTTSAAAVARQRACPPFFRIAALILAPFAADRYRIGPACHVEIGAGDSRDGGGCQAWRRPQMPRSTDKRSLQ